MTKNETFTGEVSAIAFGGNGIVRNDGLVVFVPLTAPGDKITYRITENKKNYALGKLTSIADRSPQRAIPLCPYFGSCGGCQLQHMSYEAQLEQKKQHVLDALQRIGRIPTAFPFSLMVSTEKWGYRRHITFTMRAYGERYEVGYIGTDKKTLLSIQTCSIFTPITDPIIEQLHAVVRQLIAQPNSGGRVTLLKDGKKGYVIAFHFDVIPSNMDEVIRSALCVYKNWTGVVVNSEQTYGNPVAEYLIDGLVIRVSPDAFIQNNAEQSLNIYTELCSIIQQTHSTKVLDLYCGVGISSLLLAKRGISTVGIEGNPAAIRLAKENTQQNGMAGVYFFCGDVKKVLYSDLLKEEIFDCVVINPPREGVEREVIDFLLSHRPRTIIYISCMPSTLARDLSLLCEEGYQPTYGIAFDMFPQTAHIETMVQLSDFRDQKNQNIS